MMNNGRPLGRRKTLQIVLALLVLVWATQVLLHQWGFGAELKAELAEPAEKFVPGTARFAAGGTLEVRAEATIVGAEVKLKQICRWSSTDEAVFAPIQDLVFARLDVKTPFRGITIDEIRSTLHDAGVNLAVIKFAGPTSCTVSRSDIQRTQGESLEQWITARQGKGEESGGELKATTQTVAATLPVATTQTAGETPKKLRDLLVDDLGTRLSLPIESLQMSFSPADEKTLNLSNPHFKFQIEPRRARNLGQVGWEVLIVTEGGSRKVSIDAMARAWQQQVVAVKPLSCKQLIREEDLTERRALVERLSDEPLLSKEQVVSQQAAMDLKPGTILTARMVDAVPLVRAGQLVTVVLQQGSVQVKTVARAMEGGSFGQSIRVKNEATRDIFEVVLTGPQTGRLGSDAAAVSASANVASARE